ncbi:hypothetical protein PRIPAC_70162 [Pristionchus pacificus]|uniref:Uncharacterized protein n=1 Tax=Pristionchus pacificus TaxID=54126 RepID=A0A2A6B4V8_PRIPA|nr:hypothetical protein PRIPAC_70162 [Pristionchus pacificus]|eukprot:PDM60893.1 hypothetical protein PRIPAC_54699 [Pristionchus pacificus]
MNSDCAFAEELYDLVPLHCLQWFYILTSITSVILVAYTARRSLKRTIFEDVTKELIFSLYFFIVFYSVCLIIIPLAQLSYRYAARDKCDAQVPKTWCIFRFILTVLVFSFVIIHIGITAQHTLSSFNYGRKSQKIVARLSILLSFIYPTIFAVMSYSRDTLEGRTPYCSGFTANSEGVMMVNLYLILVLDLSNAIAQSFNLHRSFHRRQNLYAMQQFMPIATLHAVVYLIFFATVFFSQHIKSKMSLVIPHYCFLCPLLFLVIIKRGRFERTSHVHKLLKSEMNPNEELIFALYFFIILYSSCLIIILLAHLISRYLATEKCDAQVPKSWCIVRYSITVTTFSFFAFGVMAYYRDTFEGRTPYCSGFTANSERVLMINLHVILVILVLDVLNALASAILWNDSLLRTANQIQHQSGMVPVYRWSLECRPIIRDPSFELCIFHDDMIVQILNRQTIRLFRTTAIFLILIRKGRFDRISDVESMLRSGENPNEKYFVALRDQ